MSENKGLVLVTGGAGFIGSHTVDALIKDGYRVRVLDNLSYPVHQHGEWPDYMNKRAELIYGDVQGSLTEVLDGVDYVFHFAAYQDYLPFFDKFFHVNSAGTANLYAAIANFKFPVKKIIVASSQSVYGEGLYFCDNCGDLDHPPMRTEEDLKSGKWDISCPICNTRLIPVPTSEGVRPSPLNSYGISKYSQEMIAMVLGKRYNIPSVCLRYSIVQGTRQSFFSTYSGILRIFVQRAFAGKPLIVFEDGNQLRDYVSIKDVVRANILCLKDNRAEDYGIFNVGGGDKNIISVKEYAELVREHTEQDVDIQIPGTYRIGDVRHIISNIASLMRLDWYPEVGLNVIIDEYIEWALGQPGFNDYSDETFEEMRQIGSLKDAQT